MVDLKKIDRRIHVIGLILVVISSQFIELVSVVGAKSKHFELLCLKSWRTMYCSDISTYNLTIDSCKAEISESGEFCDFTSVVGDRSCVNNDEEEDDDCDEEISCSFVQNSETNPYVPSLCLYRGYAKPKFDGCYTKESFDQDKEEQEKGELFESIFLYSTILNLVFLLTASFITMLYWKFNAKQLKRKKNLCLCPLYVLSTIINVIHCVLNAVLHAKLNNRGLTCYSDVYYLLFQGRAIYFGLSFVDVVISTTLSVLSAFEIREDLHNKTQTDVDAAVDADTSYSQLQESLLKRGSKHENCSRKASELDALA